MKKALVIIIIIIIIILVWALLAQKNTVPPSEQAPARADNINNMRISSPAFNHNQSIPSKYTCDGEDVNPTFVFSDVPEGTKSLVLIHDDPEATAGTWAHWTVWNISPDTKEIIENSVPSGAVEGVTDFGKPGYGGPCPPSGTHHYFFKLYALDVMLDLPTSTDAKELERAMQGHILAQAELMGLYQRQ